MTMSPEHRPPMSEWNSLSTVHVRAGKMSSTNTKRLSLSRSSISKLSTLIVYAPTQGTLRSKTNTSESATYLGKRRDAALGATTRAGRSGGGITMSGVRSCIRTNVILLSVASVTAGGEATSCDSTDQRQRQPFQTPLPRPPRQRAGRFACLSRTSVSGRQTQYLPSLPRLRPRLSRRLGRRRAGSPPGGSARGG